MTICGQYADVISLLLTSITVVGAVLAAFVGASRQAREAARFERMSRELSLLLEDLKSLQEARDEFQSFEGDGRGEPISPIELDSGIDRMNEVVSKVLMKRGYLFSEKQLSDLMAREDPGKVDPFKWIDHVMKAYDAKVRSHRKDMGLK